MEDNQSQYECIGRVHGISVPTLSEESVKALEAKLESRATKTRSTGDTRKDGGLDIISSTLLRTNHQCNSTQVCSVKMMIAQKTDNIEAIDYDILSIQFKINELINSIKALKDSRLQEKKEISFYKYILSPIRLLPHELLTRIFKYTVTVFRPSHRSESPLTLAHVCSSWRDTVFGCSYFWNQLELFVPPHTKASLGFNERVASWYGHSSSSQRLRLSVRIEGTPEDRDVHADLSQSIAAFSSRLGKLSLNFMSENYDALAPFLCLPPDSLPALEALCLLTPADDGLNDTHVLPPPYKCLRCRPMPPHPLPLYPPLSPRPHKPPPPLDTAHPPRNRRRDQPRPVHPPPLPGRTPSALRTLRKHL
ncbi:hypothetical protein D9615_006840 [Tricholomella constricta]|uniref:F-box domain-containing protein n=1 Tax=Tricholomella constricta TaxID=117010 RepID=A0A8H5H8W0_9AGAR|nr:hypothetical protein D9615_006840 [Tricholomella constricta]